MEPRMARMRGVRAPHRRTAHTAHPPVRGCGVGCAVGGANLAPTAPPVAGGLRGRVVRHQRRATTAPQDRTIPPRQPGAVTLSNENALSRFRASPHPHPPPCGPQRAAHGPGQGARADGLATAIPRRDGGSVVAAIEQRLAVALIRRSAAMPSHAWPPGGVERPRRMVRFARLIQRRSRAFGRPSAGAAFGGNLSLPWLPRRVVLADLLLLPVLICRWPGWVLPSSCQPIWCKALRDRPTARSAWFSKGSGNCC